MRQKVYPPSSEIPSSCFSITRLHNYRIPEGDVRPFSETILLFSFLIGVNLRSSAAIGLSDPGDVVR